MSGATQAPAGSISTRCSNRRIPDTSPATPGEVEVCPAFAELYSGVEPAVRYAAAALA